MSNRFADVKTVQELIYQTVGAGSMCWTNIRKAGVFDSEEANIIAKDALQRLLELLNVMDVTETTEDPNLSVEFIAFIRKPYQVRAIEITRENIHELSDLIGEFKEDEVGPYIEVDPAKVPTVTRVIPGYWLVQMGKNYRCFSPKAFQSEFTQMTPALARLMRRLDEESKVPIGA